MREKIMFAITFILFGVFNISVYQKETVLSNGTTMLLELAPRDPRSLMQGDYMVLRYAIAGNLRSQMEKIPVDGYLVLTVDKNHVAHFKRIHTPDTSLTNGEHLLQYRKRGQIIRIGAESFFFQEGHAKYYDNAKYGELRVTNSGESVLVGLRGENLISLEPNQADKRNGK